MPHEETSNDLSKQDENPLLDPRSTVRDSEGKPIVPLEAEAEVELKNKFLGALKAGFKFRAPGVGRIASAFAVFLYALAAAGVAAISRSAGAPGWLAALLAVATLGIACLFAWKKDTPD